MADEKEEATHSALEAGEDAPTLLQVGQPLTDMPSYCFHCGEEGLTRMLYTSIPYFREIVVMSFKCAECGYESTETRAAAEIQVQGVLYELTVTCPKDLNRQIVKGEYATISIPVLELELPPAAQRGSLNTIEGILSQTADHLQLSCQNHAVEEDQIMKIGEFVANLKRYERGDDDVFPFAFHLNDPSGNSFVENPFSPNDDPNLKIYHYERTLQQNNDLGILADDDELLQEAEKSAVVSSASSSMNPSGGGIAISDELMEKSWDPHGEVLYLPAHCAACSRPGEMKMLLTSIPFFRDVLLMAFNCQFCGHKSNEVKATGAIPEKGRRYVLKNAETDINRSVLKADTASVFIPELHLELTSGTLGGKFTTIEGLLTDIENALKSNPFTGEGDSHEDSVKWEVFFENLALMKEGKAHFTFILDDPLAASHIQNIYAPDDDPDLEITDYTRAFEQDEELGLHDINTEQQQD